MDEHASLTVVRAFAALTTSDATRPLITFYDDATGERAELSGATLANWVAKTANLLVDGSGLGPGDRAAVALPAHWLTAAVLLGCWSAGLVVDLAGAGPADVAFATVDTYAQVRADDVYALALAPLGLPLRPGPPPGTLDYAVEVRGYGDRYGGAEVAPQAVALSDGTSHATMAAVAATLGVPVGGRVLIDGDALPDPRSWLVAPLVVGASLVLCRHLDPDVVPARLVSERALPYP